MSNFITNEFPASSSAAWKQKIQFELDGADYNQTLLTKTIEGITISPFYHLDTFEKLNIPLREAIRNDVYHLARLGFDAYRVHVWDTEISDTLGNLIVNDHLDTFDYMLSLM